MFNTIPGAGISAAWSHYSATAADRKQARVRARTLPGLSTLTKTTHHHDHVHCTHARSCRPSARSRGSLGYRTKQLPRDCVLRLSLPRSQVCAPVTCSVAEIGGGEREFVGGCCCYGNSQASLSLISLPLCLLELWEETREEGCPETATDLREQ